MVSINNLHMLFHLRSLAFSLGGLRRHSQIGSNVPIFAGGFVEKPVERRSF